MLDYKDYLQTLEIKAPEIGFHVTDDDLNPMLFDFQKDIVKWSLRIGRVLLGENCGLGKGPQLMEICKQVHLYTDQPVIMFAPPGVKTQFKYEAEKFGYEVNIANEEDQVINGTNITNYERLIKRGTITAESEVEYLDKWQAYKPEVVRKANGKITIERFRFDPAQFSGIALDEGSILKHYGAKTRARLLEFVTLGQIKYRFVGTATPAPNDYEELIQYGEFLGLMNGMQIRALFFIQDGQTSNKFRIMHHAWHKFWAWVASWSVMIQKPSDLGYPDKGFVLPEMKTHLHTILDDKPPPGMMFAMPGKSLQEQSAIKRKSVQERCEEAVLLVNNSKESWVVWCERNDESQLLSKLIPEAVEVTGSQSEQYKEEKLMAFARGEIRIIITKPSIGGLGLNWQICHNSVSVSIDHSYEKMYQYIRRLWRFGQNENVNIHLVAMSTETGILENIAKKERQAQLMFDEIRKQMNIHDLSKIGTKVGVTTYKMDKIQGSGWQLYMGDSSELIPKELKDYSVGSTITSMPFPAMYAYTDLPNDIGNHKSTQGVVNHVRYVFEPLLKKMMPGRICSIHVAQAIAKKNTHGYIGLVDWIGPMIAMMQDCGWILHNQITIEKDPQTERARTNTVGLLFKTLKNDASQMRCSNADYIIQFRAPGDNPEPIEALLSSQEAGQKYDAPNGWITVHMWINWASNVWYKHRAGMKWWEGINVTNVMSSKKGYSKGMVANAKEARGQKDEKHLAELQLDVIERLCAVWTNPGDLIFDPFSGRGSTGWQILQMGRKYIGFELKESYYNMAISTLKQAEQIILQPDLFSELDLERTPESKAKEWQSYRQISVLEKSTDWQEMGK